MRIVEIDLPKAGDPVIHMGLAKELEGAVVTDVVVEGQLRSGQQADRHLGYAVVNDELGTALSDGGKGTRPRFRKLGRNQLVCDFRWTGRNTMKTIIAHTKSFSRRVLGFK
jgi:hypothetical protein